MTFKLGGHNLKLQVGRQTVAQFTSGLHPAGVGLSCQGRRLSSWPAPSGGDVGVTNLHRSSDTAAHTTEICTSDGVSIRMPSNTL